MYYKAIGEEWGPANAPARCSGPSRQPGAICYTAGQGCGSPPRRPRDREGCVELRVDGQRVLVTAGAAGMDLLAAVDARPHLRDLPYITEMRAVVHAWQMIDVERGADAISLLRPFVDGSARYQTHRALMQAYLLTGDRDSAMRQVEWLRQKRGLAYIEQGCGQCRQTLNVADSDIAVNPVAKNAD